MNWAEYSRILCYTSKVFICVQIDKKSGGEESVRKREQLITRLQQDFYSRWKTAQLISQL